MYIIDNRFSPKGKAVVFFFCLFIRKLPLFKKGLI